MEDQERASYTRSCLRKVVTDPNDPAKTIEVPDMDGIKSKVDQWYAYNPHAPVGRWWASAANGSRPDSGWQQGKTLCNLGQSTLNSN